MQPTHAPAQPLPDEAILSLARKAARAAGEVQLNCREKTLTVDRLYAHDIKLEADRLSEDAIVRTVREQMPDAAFMAEESGEIEGSGELVWIVDPLDGTMNYYHGQHHFCTCVACYRRDSQGSSAGLSRLGTPVAGVVYAAAYDEEFFGMPSAGSACNHTRLVPSSVDQLTDAIVATSFGSREEVMTRMDVIVHELVRKTHKVRLQGCCGLDICGVAAGRLSALYQSDVRCWDFAAARIILEEAGGMLEAIEVAPNRWNVLAAAPGVFDDLQALVNSQ